METEIICTIITGIVSIVTASLAIFIKVSQDKSEKRAERRRQESLLSLEMMAATLELTEATANAVLGKTNNGNVEKAYKKTDDAKRRYNEFERQVLSEEIM